MLIETYPITTNKNWFLRSVDILQCFYVNAMGRFKYLSYHQRAHGLTSSISLRIRPAETLSCNTCNEHYNGRYSEPEILLYYRHCIIPTHVRNRWISKTVLASDKWTRDSGSCRWCSRARRCVDIAGASLRRPMFPANLLSIDSNNCMSTGLWQGFP